METKARPFGDRATLIDEASANWALSLPDDADRFGSVVCALAHERRLVNDLLAAAGKVRHWHDAMADGSGMVVSAEAVHDLWDVVARIEGGTDERGESVADLVEGGGLVMPLGKPRNHQEEIDSAVAAYDAMAAHVGGCSNGTCVVQKPVGMHTNGPCHCHEDKTKARRMMMAGSKLRHDLVAGGEVRAALRLREASPDAVDMRGKLGAGRVSDGLTPPMSRHRTDGK